EIFVRLIDIAVYQFEAEAFGACLFTATGVPRLVTSRCRARSRRFCLAALCRAPTVIPERPDYRQGASGLSERGLPRCPSGRVPEPGHDAPAHRRTAFAGG